MSDWKGKPTLEQTEQFEFALESHGIDDFRVRKIFNPDDKAITQFSESLRQAGIGLRRQRLNIGEGWCSQRSPMVELACHANVVGEVPTPTKRLTARPRMGNGCFGLT